MRKFYIVCTICFMVFLLASCSEKSDADRMRNVSDPIVQNSEAAAGELTEETVRSFLRINMESWECEIKEDSYVSGDTVNFKASANYYISELDNTVDSKIVSVLVRHIKLGDREFYPVQTSSSALSAEMLASFGYGEDSGPVLIGYPYVVFLFSGEASGVYNSENGIIEVPFQISCSVNFENGEEIIVDYEYDFIAVDSYSICRFTENDFVGY